MEQGLLAKRFKEQIEDPRREEEIMERVKNNPNTLVEQDFSEDLYKIILNYEQKAAGAQS
jgi:chorismate mutase